MWCPAWHLFLCPIGHVGCIGQWNRPKGLNKRSDRTADDCHIETLLVKGVLHIAIPYFRYVKTIKITNGHLFSYYVKMTPLT